MSYALKIEQTDKADCDYEAMAMQGMPLYAIGQALPAAYVRGLDHPPPDNDNSPLDALRDLPGLIYVATPYSDYPFGHAAAAYDAASAAAKLMKRGLRVVSPIAHSHAVATVGRLDAVDHDFWQHQDQPLVDAASACVVVMLEGWATSRGVRHEIECFARAGKSVVYVTMDGI